MTERKPDENAEGRARKTEGENPLENPAGTEDPAARLSEDAVELLSSTGDISAAFQRMRRGDQEACAKLWDYFQSELVRRAGLRLSPGVRRRVDPEDIVNTAFRTFVRRAEQGEFSEIEDRDDILARLTKIVVRRAIKRVKKEQATIRDYRREADDSMAQAATDAQTRPVSLCLRPDIGAEDEAEFKERIAQLVKALPEQGNLRAIGKAWLENDYSPQAVKEVLGLKIDVRGVQRKIKTIREKIWQPLLLRMDSDQPIK